MSTPESEISLEDKLTATAHAERLARAHRLTDLPSRFQPSH